MADLTSSIEVQAIGRTWLMIYSRGRSIGQLVVNDDELPGVLAIIPLDDSKSRDAGPQAMGGRKTSRAEVPRG